MKNRLNGNSHIGVILASVFGGLLAITIVGLIILLINYFDIKNNLDAKVNLAVAEAKKKQADKLESDFAEREKKPYLQFTGPEDLGRLTFKYPKTWSTYVDDSGSAYKVFMSPKYVKSKNKDSKYALWLEIIDQDYDKIVSKYANLVNKGDLKSTVLKVADITGTRFDGKFSKNLRGSAVIIKNRDKTVILHNDLTTFKKDFDNLVSTIQLNK